MFKYDFFLNLDEGNPRYSTPRPRKVIKLWNKLRQDPRFGLSSGVRVTHVNTGLSIELNSDYDLDVIKTIHTSALSRRSGN